MVYINSLLITQQFSQQDFLAKSFEDTVMQLSVYFHFRCYTP